MLYIDQYMYILYIDNLCRYSCFRVYIQILVRDSHVCYINVHINLSL